MAAAALALVSPRAKAAAVRDHAQGNASAPTRLAPTPAYSSSPPRRPLLLEQCSFRPRTAGTYDSSEDEPAISPKKALRAVSSTLATSRTRVLGLESAVARGLRDRAEQEKALTVLRAQVQRLTAQVATEAPSPPRRLPPISVARGRSVEAAARLSAIDSFLSRTEASLRRPALHHAIFASWRAASIASRVRRRVRSFVLLETAATCREAYAEMVCFSSWSRLCVENRHQKPSVDHAAQDPRQIIDFAALLVGQRRVEDRLAGLEQQQALQSSIAPTVRSRSKEKTTGTDEPRRTRGLGRLEDKGVNEALRSSAAAQPSAVGFSQENPYAQLEETSEIPEDPFQSHIEKAHAWRDEHHKELKNELVEVLQTENNWVAARLLAAAALHEFTPEGPPDTPLAKFVESSLFTSLIGAVILANTLVIGLESDAAIKAALSTATGTPEQVSDAYSTITHVFTATFAVELGLKLYGLRLWFFLGDGWVWNIFDALLVTSSLVQLLLQGLNLNFLRILRVFRMIRALRILRTLRLFRELRRMTLAIMACMVSLSWAFSLLLLITYVFSIMFVQAAAAYVAESSPVGEQLDGITEMYGSLVKAIYYLLQAISGGNDWGGIAEPLEPMSYLYLVIFVIYVLFVTFGVLNVLTGVFLESASEIMDRDLLTQAEVARKRSFAQNLQQLFKELDLSGNGELTWQEFSEALQVDRVQAFFTAHDLNVLDAHTLFSLLATDHDTVNESGFIFGCERFKGQARTMHVERLRQEYHQMQESFSEHFSSLDSQLCSLHLAIGDLQVERELEEPPPEVSGPPCPEQETSSASDMVCLLGDEGDRGSATTPARCENKDLRNSQRKFEWNKALTQSMQEIIAEEPERSKFERILPSWRPPATPPDTSAAKFVLSNCFVSMMGCLILANTAVVGIESDAAIKHALADEKPPGYFALIANIFTVCYSVELAIKLYALRCWFFCGDETGWNLFDLFLVVVSLVQMVLDHISGDSAGGSVGFLRVLRVFKMIRALRILRVLSFFRELRRMTLAIVSCLASLSWAFLLLLLITYVFSILFVQAASTYVDEQGNVGQGTEGIESMYGGLMLTMYSLVQAISGGNDWGNIAEPLQSISPVYTLIFMLYVLFVTFGVMNVLTGVFLESAAEILDHDLVMQAEVARKSMFAREMQTIFKDLDYDGSGRISWDEFHRSLKDPRIRAFFMQQQLDTIDAHLLFTLIADGKQDVDLHDFIMGCWKMVGAARSMSFEHMDQEVQIWQKDMDFQIRKVQQQLQGLQNELGRIRRAGRSPERSVSW